MNDQEPISDEPPGDPAQSNLVRIRLPTGEHEWVTPEAFNLISEKEFQDSDRLRRLRRERNVALTVAGATSLAVVAGVLAWWLRGREAVPVEEALVTPPVPAATEPVAAAEPVIRDEEAPPTAGASSEITTAPAADAGGEIEEVVRAWARAWSAQDVEGYLGFYSARFRVPQGLTRSAWESLRRQRIGNPRRIAVTVSDVEATLTGETSAVARFGQGYRAPGYRDWVLKTFELEREPAGWRIVEERSALIEVGGAPGGGETRRE